MPTGSFCLLCQKTSQVRLRLGWRLSHPPFRYSLPLLCQLTQKQAGHTFYPTETTPEVQYPQLTLKGADPGLTCRQPTPPIYPPGNLLGWSSSGYSGWLHPLLLSLEPLLPENPSPGELSHRLLQEAPSDLDPLVMTAVHFGAFGTSLKHPFEPVTFFFFLVVVKKQNTYHEICPLNKVLRVQSSVLNYHCRVIEQLSRTFSSCMTLCTH